jgi:hypothetical protein
MEGEYETQEEMVEVYLQDRERARKYPPANAGTGGPKPVRRKAATPRPG